MKGNHWMEIRNDRKKGLSYTEIAKKYHMDPRTAKKYAESDSKPAYQLTSPKTSKLALYKPQIDLWLEEAPYSAVRIHEKLVEQGCDCKYTIVRQYVSSKKLDLNEKATVRFETMPGLQGQVDWGFFENYKVLERGEYKKLCILIVFANFYDLFMLIWRIIHKILFKKRNNRIDGSNCFFICSSIMEC